MWELIKVKLAVYRNALLVFAAVASVAASFVAGWKIEAWRCSAKESARLEAAAKSKIQSDRTARESVKNAQRAETKPRIIYRTIRERIPDATDGRVCFTHDSLRLWNSAIAGQEPVPENPTGISGRSGRVDSVATDEQILKNATDNFELCQKFRRRIQAIKQWDSDEYGSGPQP